MAAVSHNGQPANRMEDPAGALWLGWLSEEWFDDHVFGRVSPAEPPSCALARWMLVPGHELAQRGMTHDDLFGELDIPGPAHDHTCRMAGLSCWPCPQGVT